MTQPPRRAYAYVDGFNLYYGCLEGSDWKWLDVDALLRRLFPKYEIAKIKYFTAQLIGQPSRLPGEPEPREESAKRVRQGSYIRALKTLPNLEPYYGHFLHKTEDRPVAYPLRDQGRPAYDAVGRPIYGRGEMVTVWDAEEKGSDVNLATHLILDACNGAFDLAIVMTNDSDQTYAVEMVRTAFKLPIAVVPPVLDPDPRRPRRPNGPPRPRGTISGELRTATGQYVVTIKAEDLAACQFPVSMPDQFGTVRKPDTW